MTGAAQRLLAQRCAATATREASAAEASPNNPSTAAASSSLQLYNTMSGRKEPFTLRDPSSREVLMYVCGVTVYDFSHVGHARVYTTFDLLYRVLQRLGYQVNYVRNFTDVDDKIINRANERNEDIAELSNRFITEFHSDMERLNCLQPTLEPRATDHIKCMVASIEQMLANNHAYVDGGNVWFDVGSLPGYGRLSRRSKQEAGPEDTEGQVSTGGKRAREDFALWKAGREGEPGWDSPWGRGRPGWHLECSSMIRELMGPVIDIHGGGRDLVFPHHENEIAQAQAAAGEQDREHMPHGREFVRFWVHNGFVNVDSEKMSKSLGNFFTIRDVVALYPALALRLFLLSTQYRQAVNYTQRALEEASDRLYYFYQAMHDADELLQSSDEGQTAARQASEEQAGKGPGSEALEASQKAMCDDLNTPEVLAQLAGLLKEMNDLLHTKKGRKSKDRLSRLAGMSASVRSILDLLGLWTGDTAALITEMRGLALTRAGLTEAEVADSIEQRNAARKEKDFAKGDSLREQLAQKGVMLMDGGQGTTWRPGPKLDVAQSGS
ncbi:hypothetical protein WJX73_008335 [Symbiochloris irregularis]|uniref:cysteine--tRNA ligase n=1 Tax=Symbiochloris irregularis TaxID=706552 RepID=A0AAW1P5A7_9CHLO